MPKPTLLFVVVNYFSEEEVARFFRQEVLKQNTENWCLTVVDNGSTNTAILNELSEQQGVHIIKPEKNTGYLGAAGKAFEYFVAQFGELPQMLVLSNSDMHYCDQNMFHYWQQSYAESNDIGMIGCRITSSLTGKPQNPMYRQRLEKSNLDFLIHVFSSKLAYLAYQTAALLKGKILSLRKDASQTNRTEQVYALHGSCMVLHRSLLQQKDIFSDAPFLFGEEVYLAEICHREKLHSVFDPAQEILHQEHQTTGIFKSDVQRLRMVEALSLIVKKFHSA